MLDTTATGIENANGLLIFRAVPNLGLANFCEDLVKRRRDDKLAKNQWTMQKHGGYSVRFHPSPSSSTLVLPLVSLSLLSLILRHLRGSTRHLR